MTVDNQRRRKEKWEAEARDGRERSSVRRAEK